MLTCLPVLSCGPSLEPACTQIWRLQLHACAANGTAGRPRLSCQVFRSCPPFPTHAQFPSLIKSIIIDGVNYTGGLSWGSAC